MNSPAVGVGRRFDGVGTPLLLAPTLHPAVAALPPEHETSIESVAKYLVEAESDPVQRVKALHDYVADRIAYDAEALAAGRFPPQDAKTVFERRSPHSVEYQT